MLHYFIVLNTMKSHLLECVVMQNYKVEVQNHSEGMEAQDLFLEIGFKKSTLLEDGYPKYVVADQVSLTDGKESGGAHISFVGTNYKKITLQELRAMVAPKQKEYLVKTDTGYTLQVLYDVIDGHDGIIEVPEGAEILTACGLALYFWNKTNNTTWVDGEGWVSCDDERLCTLKSYLSDKDVKIVWQRESLNDQVASAEQARQEQTQTREISECDLIDSGKLIIGGFGESFPVGLEHHKFIQPEGFSEGGFIPKQNHGAPVGLLHHGFSGFTQPEELPFVSDNAWNKQIGGDHYKKLAIQPMEYALQNKLDYAQANVVKYVTRHADKNGKQDLLKAIHNIELMIAHYYSDQE